MNSSFLTITHKSNKARTGFLTLDRGTIQTPAFMPVGTYGAIKALAPDRVKASGAEIVLSNTYHLMLRPTAERIAKLGGLHQFMNWQGPILTDSGGFQIMSLGQSVKITPAAAQFRSHIDGALIELSPERAMEVQALLGSDIQMVLDECLKLPASEDEIKASVELSLNWAARSKKAASAKAKVFGIIQGGLSQTQRLYSAQETVKLGFAGLAIGGLSVGESQEEMIRVLTFTLPSLPEDKPRYLMGVGRPDDIVHAVAQGIDMFDCVLPSREARHGRAYTEQGAFNLSNARYADDPTPLSANSAYSRAYVHHLLKISEPLGMTILTENNLTYYQNLMSGIRAAIKSDSFSDFSQSVLAIYKRT